LPSADGGVHRARAFLLILLSATTVAGTITPGAARSADPVTLHVQGSLASITTSGPALTPSFAPSTTDYVLRCQAGANPISVNFEASAGGTIQLGTQSGTHVTASATLVENQALIVEGTGGTYWIRCLPHDFPHLHVTKPGSPPPGWYLTGNVTAAGGSSTYAMILDRNGTPVWYQKTAGEGAINVTPLARNTVAWTSIPTRGTGFGSDPGGFFSAYDLATQTTRRLKTREPPLDFHDLLPLQNGHRLMLASPLRAGMDLRVLGLGRNRTIVDCLIEEVNASGGLVSLWRASDHIRLRESRHPFAVIVDRQQVYDVYHCNSVDWDPVTGDVLLSLRHTDAVYRIDARSGSIRWKLGGNSVVGDREQHLAIEQDPETTFYGQHDARFEPNDDISLYDGHTWFSGAARGVEYHVDTRAGTATLVWQYQSPDGAHSDATGSFRRYANGDDNLVTWGFKPYTLFTEVDGAGTILLNLTFPDGEAAYRTIKAPVDQFDVDLLRRTAGLAAASFPPAPRVLSVGPAIGHKGGRATVTIIGTGFAGATAVRFGTAKASSFTVDSDSSITARAPSGSGTVKITVTTPGGVSPTRPPNMLVGSDATFTTGTGSWAQNVNTRVALSRAISRSPGYSLELKPRRTGFASALTSGYPVSASAHVTGSVWARTALGRERVRAALVFYDKHGSTLSIAQGRFVPVSGRWTRVAVTGTSPASGTSVALAVDAAEGNTILYVDDASLTGSVRFTYQ
jgi:hypothetical protein